MSDWIGNAIVFVSGQIQEIDFHPGHFLFALFLLFFIILLYRTHTLFGLLKLFLFIALAYSLMIMYQRVRDATLDFTNSGLFNDRHCVSATQYYDGSTIDLCKEATRKLSLGVEGIAFELFHRDMMSVVYGAASQIFTPSVFYVLGVACILTLGWVVKDVIINQMNNDSQTRAQMKFTNQFANWASRFTRRNVTSSIRRARLEDHLPQRKERARIEEID